MTSPFQISDYGGTLPQPINLALSGQKRLKEKGSGELAAPSSISMWFLRCCSSVASYFIIFIYISSLLLIRLISSPVRTALSDVKCQISQIYKGGPSETTTPS